MRPWDELEPEEQEPYYDLAIQILDNEQLLWCSRDWSAWSVGTMREDDFHPASEECDGEAQLIYEFVQKNGLRLLLEPGSVAQQAEQQD